MDEVARVVVGPEPIGRAGQVGEGFVDPGEAGGVEAHPARADRIVEGPVEGGRGTPGREPVGERPARGRLEVGQVHRDTHLGARRRRAQGLGALRVGAKEAGRGLHGLGRRFPSRRPDSRHVAQVHLDVRLVQHAPELDVGPEAPGGFAGEPGEAIGEFRSGEAPAIGHPDGEREVEQRHHRGDVRLGEEP